MDDFTYLQALNAPCRFEDEQLVRMRAQAEEEGVPVMRRDTAAAMHVFCAMKRPKRILEIGTAIGYSGILMLRAAAEGAKLTTIEQSETAIARAKANFQEAGFSSSVRIFAGDACDIVPNLSGAFDLIFLDGPKARYADFLPYLYDVLAKDGVLIADNVLFRGMISGEKEHPHRMQTIVNNMRAYLDAVTEHPGLSTVVLDTGDGIAISVLKNTKEKREDL